MISSDQAHKFTFKAIKWCLEDGVLTESAHFLVKVILNCYNRYDYPKVELAGLWGLDHNEFVMGICVIQLRHMGIEAHQVVNDGDKCMDRIRKIYRIRRCRT